MGPFLQLITGPLTALMSGAGDLIGKFVASPEDKLKAQQELAQLSIGFQQALLNSSDAFAKLQADVIESESKGESWLQRNWRPLLMLTFMVIIANNYIVFPYFAAAHMVEIPPDMWALLKLGMTGYIVGRSIEKAGPDVAAIVTGRK